MRALQTPFFARAAVALLTALALALPATADAAGFGRRSRRASDDEKEESEEQSSQSSSAAPARSGGFGRARPAPPREERSSGRDVYEYDPHVRRERRHRHDRVVVVHDHHPGYWYADPWWGRYRSSYYYSWGVYPWGYYSWGYHPLWGAPPPPEREQPRPAGDTSLALLVGGMAPRPGAALFGHLNLDVRRWGFNLDAVALPSVNPWDPYDVARMPLFSGHATYSLLAGSHGRLRVEGGATAILAPDMTYAGPDVGLSGQLALAGPLGLYGSFHVTPFPALITDTQVGLSLQFGALGLRAGWRALRLDDTRVNEEGGVDILRGPVVGIGLVY